MTVSDAELADRIAQLVSRLEELSTEVATLVDTASGLADPIDFEPLAVVGERQQAIEKSLAQVRALVEAVVDGMPGSIEGSADPPVTRRDLDAAVTAIADAVAERLDARHEAEPDGTSGTVGSAGTKEALVDHLLAHSVRRGEFVLKSGKRSDWFIDAKQTTCRPEGMLLVADAALAVIPDDATAIGGLTMGADAVAFGVAALAAARGRELRSFSVRKEVKDHGGGGRLAGALEPGDRVVIVEDAVTRGVSMLEAADVVAEAGAHAVLLLPVVDRGGTVAAMAAERGLSVVPLVTAPDLGFDYEG